MVAVLNKVIYIYISIYIYTHLYICTGICVHICISVCISILIKILLSSWYVQICILWLTKEIRTKIQSLFLLQFDQHNTCFFPACLQNVSQPHNTSALTSASTMCLACLGHIVSYRDLTALESFWTIFSPCRLENLHFSFLIIWLPWQSVIFGRARVFILFHFILVSDNEATIST